MPSPQKRILILCKTYPSPSAKHAETSCVAGMDEGGRLFRLYPVPFRLIADEQQFKKWQWVTARIQKSKEDHRPESHKVFVDTIKCDPKPLPTTNNWSERRRHLDKLQVFDDFNALDEARKHSGTTLALLRPRRIVALEIKEGSPEWTQQEQNKLVQAQRQAGLFDTADAASIRTLRKLPYDFYYRYECARPTGNVEYRHKIVDWEAGALFWNVRRAHSAKWEAPFRAKMEQDLPAHDLIFLMGTIHRFPDQWLIVSLIYPPRQRPVPDRQGSLFEA